jgi:predicted small lipoprotein YifL
MRNFILMFIAATLMAGCGLKGPLYLPSDKPAATPPSPPSATRPVPSAQTEDRQNAGGLSPR